MIVRKLFWVLIFCVVATVGLQGQNPKYKKTIAYIVSDLNIPFWDIMARGMSDRASEVGYGVTLYSSSNNLKTEIQNTVKAIREGVDGIILSPISSSSCVTLLSLAHDANIPVVIADIGTDSGEYLSYISSDNLNGAFGIGEILAKEMIRTKKDNAKVGIVAIPQKRSNGRARTQGFVKAMDHYDIKIAGIKQQVDFSYQETYDHTLSLLNEHHDIKAIWLQGSDKYQGALDAIAAKGLKNDVLLVTFDAEPIFLELIPKGVLVGAAMQQPYLMGDKALETIKRHFDHQPIEKNIKMKILPVSKENITKLLPTIKKNVLGIVD